MVSTAAATILVLLISRGQSDCKDPGKERRQHASEQILSRRRFAWRRRHWFVILHFILPAVGLWAKLRNSLSQQGSCDKLYWTNRSAGRMGAGRDIVGPSVVQDRLPCTAATAAPKTYDVGSQVDRHLTRVAAAWEALKIAQVCLRRGRGR